MLIPLAVLILYSGQNYDRQTDKWTHKLQKINGQINGQTSYKSITFHPKLSKKALSRACPVVFPPQGPTREE